jgi:putative two-component system response regulator
MKDKPKILIVDDSSTIRSYYFSLLKRLEAKIQSAENGREALKMALSIPFDLIITDVKMVRMSGIDLCLTLQKFPFTRDIPVIIVSTFDSESDVEIGFKAGATAYLSKKDAENLLLKTVSEILWKYSHVRQRRILVVEDSRTIAQSLELGLTKNAFSVTLAENGRVAKEILGDVKPDLIVCDLQMPEMDGFAFCKWLKAAPEFSDIPLVAMSVDEEKAIVQRIIQYGAAAFVRKPFSMTQLVPLIDRILSDHFKIILKERERLDTERMAFLNSITSLVTALEARDTYTRGHSESVSILATQMLAHSGADKADIELIGIGGRLHDIGKIGIRDSVLLKPGKLTDEEFTHIKDHPTIGKRILSAIPSLEQIVPICYSHHERWDGGGYPKGLKGETIPFWARIVSVADMFDALTSDRPYRDGMSREKAFSIIKEVKGTQLCPESVELFFKVIQTDD